MGRLGVILVSSSLLFTQVRIIVADNICIIIIFVDETRNKLNLFKAYGYWTNPSQHRGPLLGVR